MSEVDDMLRTAREVQPDLWKRTEQVARIIAPEAFMDDWIIEPEECATTFRLKLQLMQATAMRKAHDVLTVLGVNTETEWHEILQRMAEGVRR